MYTSSCPGRMTLDVKCDAEGDREDEDVVVAKSESESGRRAGSTTYIASLYVRTAIWSCW